MDKFQSGSLTLHFRSVGVGRPLLLLHGFLEDHSIWDNVSPVFEKEGFRVIAVDLPCHGLSRFDGDRCTMAEMAQLLHAFLLSQNIAEPFVIGHSMGGYVALELLRVRPANLTLLHSNFWADNEEKKKDRNRVIEVVRNNRFSFLAEAIPNLFAPQNRQQCANVIAGLIEKASLLPPAEIAAATAGMRDRRPSHDLINHVGVNMIQGLEDPVVPVTVLEEQCRLLRRKPLVIDMADCGHMSIWEQPVGLINALRSILIE